jgi:uncharacterized protein YndB with AHSA1/START domain
MHTRNGAPRYDYEIYIGASPDQVWEALCDGDLTQQYAFGTRFEGRLATGEPYAFVDDRAFRSVEGEILEVAPKTRLVLTWRARWDPAVEQDPPSRVTYELEPMSPATTRLRLTHDQFDAETATYEGSVTSWPLMLSSLKTLLESGKPLPTS